ncbi:MAG: hypothetical protein ACJ79S_12355 [Gemmatimonadaceae bacterium]
MPWELTGNIGTNPGANYLGTTDGQPLAIRTTAVEAIRVAPNGSVGVGTTAPKARLHVEGGDILWGNDSRLARDQGGSIELGGDPGTPGTGTPYIDFHFSGLAQDFNTRIINDADGQLTVAAGTFRALGNVTVAGDVILFQADVAEQFPLAEDEAAEPGTVMVFDDGGELRECTNAYDRRVAGVVSGAGDQRPAIVLDRKDGQAHRATLALVGKVFCKVDAVAGAIEVGDLLTTSATSGHAMKAGDPRQAFGAVIGKALRPLGTGRGLIPILVALQ